MVTEGAYRGPSVSILCRIKLFSVAIAKIQSWPQRPFAALPQSFRSRRSCGHVAETARLALITLTGAQAGTARTAPRHGYGCEGMR
jgi:hypothetical protein